MPIVNYKGFNIPSEKPLGSGGKLIVDGIRAAADRIEANDNKLNFLGEKNQPNGVAGLDENGKIDGAAMSLEGRMPNSNSTMMGLSVVYRG